MLPNHAPLMVAERFKVLEALYPGRIDLGIGRAPGTDHVTSVALRRRQDIGDDDDFLDRFQELLLFENNGYPADHPFRNVHAMPNDVALPPIFLLGSSDYSRAARGPDRRGLFLRASFLGPRSGRRRCGIYREKFQPSQFLQKPLCHPRGRRGRGRHRRRSRPACLHHRSEFRAPRQGRLCAAGKSRGRARL